MINLANMTDHCSYRKVLPTKIDLGSVQANAIAFTETEPTNATISASIFPQGVEVICHVTGPLGTVNGGTFTVIVHLSNSDGKLTVKPA